MRKKTYLFIAILQIAIVVGFLTFFKITMINGQSMSPTLTDKQITLVYKGGNNYEIGDIITVDTDQYGVCVKRIVAKEGDEIKLCNGKILRNGIELTPYTCETEQKYVLGNGEYFVLGDNYNASIDSRDYGPVMQRDIIGKVILY